MITVSNVSVQFGKRVLFNDVNLKLPLVNFKFTSLNNTLLPNCTETLETVIIFIFPIYLFTIYYLIPISLRIASAKIVIFP